MNNIFNPEYGVIADRHRQVIGVTGAGSGAGATFTAMGIALKMAEMTKGVTFVEGKPHGSESRSPYRILAVDRDFKEKRFQDFFADAYQNGEGGGRPGLRTNLHHKVNWVVRGPAASADAPAAPDCRLLPGSHIIVDRPEKPEDMDLIVCIIDPLPSRILSGLETFRRIREQSLIPVIWVMNKSNAAAPRRPVEDFLKIRFTHTIPLVSPEHFYRAEFDCSLPPFEQAEEAFRTIAEEILLHN